VTTGAITPVTGADLAGLMKAGPQAGQMIRAVIMAQLEGGLVRLALPGGGSADVRAPAAFAKGTVVDVAVERDPAASRAALQYVIKGEAAPAGRASEKAALPQASLEPRASGRAEAAAAHATQAVPVVTPPKTPAAERAQIAAAAGQVAVQRQGGLAPLIADLAQAVTSLAPPAAVRAAAEPLLAQPLPLDRPPTGQAVKQALAQSGLFLEQRLAAAPAPGRGSALANPVAGDLKAALLVFRQVLQAWQPAAKAAAPPPVPTAPMSAAPALAPAVAPSAATVPGARSTLPTMPTAGASSLSATTQGLAPPPTDMELPSPASSPERAAESARPPAAPGAQTKLPPPPYRDGPLDAQPAVGASRPEEADVHKVVQRLIQQTGGALARQELFQIASLPEAASPQRPDPPSRWMFEIPFAAPQGPTVAQFEISRDGREPGSAEAAEATWRARFSIDIEPMGPIHAQVALIGDRAQVSLWAEREAGLERLRLHAPLLTKALAGAEWTAEVSFHAGAPARASAPSGHFVDLAS